VSSLIRLEIKPSIRVALALSLPFVVSITLIATRDITVLPFVSICLLIGAAGYYFVCLLGFVSFETSITELQITDSQIFLVDKKNGKKEYELYQEPILNQYFCILSFSQNKFEALGSPHPLTRLISPYKHIIVSRYNTEDMASFRKARVKLRFGRQSLFNKASI